MQRRPSVTHMPSIAVILVAAACAVLGGGVASAAQAPAPKVAPSRTYVVRPGDGGWFQIARAQGVPMQQLLAANHATTGTRVVAGEKLRLPAGAKAKAKAAGAHLAAPRHAPPPVPAAHAKAR